VKLIVAVNKKGYIGKGGKMLWHSTDDFKHFKKMTANSLLVVGKTTFEECMGGRHLPGRACVVIGKGTYQHEAQTPQQPQKGSTYFTIPEAFTGISIVELHPLLHGAVFYKNVWIIGGKQIYDHFVHLCDEVHMSLINDDQEGDTKWEVPANYRGKVFYYEFEPTKAKNEGPGVDTELPPQDEKHANDE
jgi:dihydrofolate reductase